MRFTRSSSSSLLPALLLTSWSVITMVLWWLAFSALDDAPEWLRRTQAVCFGNLPGGLPDTYGYLTLILTPGSLLVGFFAIYSGEIVASLRQMSARPAGAALLVALAAGMLTEVIWIGLRIDDGLELRVAVQTIPGAAGPMPEGYARLDRRAPAFSLVDQAGRIVTLDDVKGRPSVISFAFAHCATICPTLVKQIQSEAKGFLPGTPILYVTLDPWRDTPGALPDVAQKWGLGADERLLSGAPDDVTRVLDAFMVPRGRDEKTGDVSHPALAYVLDGNGTIAYALQGEGLSWLDEAVKRASEAP